jgi:hypothetical protein
MDLLDNAKKQIKNIANTTTITYGFIGITTCILSYYTFFENDIETPVNEPEPIVNQPIVNQPEPMINQPEPMINQPEPMINQPEPMINQPQPMINQPQPIVGGATRRRKHTRRHK